MISEQPRLLQHILLTKTVNPESVCLVHICLNGLWKTIIVDDCFPCTKHKHLVFTQAKRCQSFVPLIEKVCAKLFVSYASLKGGNMAERLQLLTGAPCDHLDLQPPDYALGHDFVWAKLLSPVWKSKLFKIIILKRKKALCPRLLIGVSSSRNVMSSEEYAHACIHDNNIFFCPRSTYT